MTEPPNRPARDEQPGSRAPLNSLDPDPFQRLRRSHRRLEEELDRLRVAAVEKDVVTLRSVAEFLSHQVARHEEDEERSLFPRLRQLADADIDIWIARLEAEHRAHEALGARLDRAIDALDRDERVDESVLTDAAEAIVVAYDAHIALEDRELFPRAERLLPAEERGAILTEMMERRAR